MAEKEKAPSYEATGQQQKPTGLQLPPLTSKQQATCGLGNKDSNHRNVSDPPAAESYYLNIAQKGKLMLPTALWVMLILAGICFLTLLVSLNKTIGSIETLVELEQEKEARAQLDALIHAHHHSRSNEANGGASKIRSEDRKDDEAKKAKDKTHDGSTNKERKHKSKHHEMPLDETNKAEIFGPGIEGAPLGGSWFDFPSWTSLEPRHREHSHQYVGEGELVSPPLPPPMSFLKDLFGDVASQPLMGQDRDEPEVSILLTSGPLMEVGPERPPRNDAPEDGLMGSFIKQVLPIFGSTIGDDRAEPDPRHSHGGRLEESSASRDDDHNSYLPSISAKIDNLNVHINGPGAGSDAGERVRFEASSGGPTQEEEIRSLEKSIDDLVSKLVDQKSKPHELDRPQQVEEIVPIVRHPHGGAAHNKHSFHSDHSPLSPLASLLSPPGLFDSTSSPSPDPIFFQTIDGGDDLSKMLLLPQSLHKSKHHSRRPFDDQDSGPLIISISDGQDPVNENVIFKASGETDRHGARNTRRPPFGQSPYEVPFLPPFALDDSMAPFGFEKQSKFSSKPHHEHHHVTKAKVDKPSDAEWDMFANGLADSLVQNMFPRPRKPSVQMEEPQIIMIDGDMPLAPGERQNFITSLLMPDSFLPRTDMIEPESKNKGHKLRPSNRKEQTGGDTISLFFGSPADPFASFGDLFQSQKSNEKAAHKSPAVSTEKPSMEKVDASSKPQTATPASVTKENIVPTDGTAGTTAIPRAPSSAGIGQPISQPPTNEPRSRDEDKLRRKEAEDIISGIMGDIFTIPESSGMQVQSTAASLLPSTVGPAI